MRQALRQLADLGYIRREQGRGTFVQRRALEQGPRELTSFTDEMRRHGLLPSSQILESGSVAAAGDAVVMLRVSPGHPLFRLRRLRLADGEPMGLQTAYVPMELVPGIDAVAFTAASLYDVLRDRYSLSPASARETHVAVALGDEDASWLQVAPGSPAMAAHRVAYLADGRPLEYVESMMRGDRYKVVLDLVQKTGR